MQSFVGDHVLLGQHLPARGADVAVEVGGGVRLPNVLFVLFGFVGALFLLDPEVVVSKCWNRLLMWLTLFEQGAKLDELQRCLPPSATQSNAL